MATRTVATRLAVEGIPAYTAALKGVGDVGDKELRRLGGAAEAANQNVSKLDRGVGGLARTGSSNLLQQAGFQIGDFAVQVQSGTNAVVAFTQQGSQFLGAFGQIGAVVGGVLSIVGAFATYMMRTGEETNSAAKELATITEGTDQYKRSLEAAQPFQIAFLETMIRTNDEYQRRQASLEEENARRAAESALAAPEGVVEIAPEDRARQEKDKQAALAGMSDIDKARHTLNEQRRAEDKAAHDARMIQLKQEEDQVKKTYMPSTSTKAESGTGAAYDYLPVETYEEALAELTAQREKDTAAAASSAKQAATLAVTNEKLLETAKLATAASEAELEAVTMGEDARKRANVERQYELDLLNASQPAQKAVQLALIDEANARRVNELATIEEIRYLKERQELVGRGGQTGSMGQFYDTKFSGANTPNPAVDTLKGVGDETKNFARIQEEILLEPWRNLASGVSQITTNMFDEILEKGKISFESLATGVEDLFRTTIAGAMGNIVAAPINMAIAEIANNASKPGGTLTGAFSQFGKEHPYATAVAGGAAGGYAVGTAYGQLTGKQDTYASTGGAVGGAAGGAIGQYYGNPVLGAAIGSFAGSFIGGLFGGEGLGNDQSVQKFGSKAAKAIWSDKSFSEENRKVTGGIIEQLGALSEALTATGANINDIQLAISAGNKTGIQVQGKGYGSAEEAMAGAIRLLLKNTGGLQGSQVTALKTTRGRNVQEVMEDLAFAKEFDRITFAGTAAEAAMRDLTEEFDATARKAKTLGLNEAALTAARERAMAQLMLAAQRQARDLGAQFMSAITTDPLQQALIGINQQFATLTDSLIDAGYSAEALAQVESARVSAEERARRQVAEQAEAEAEAKRQQAEAESEQRRAEAEAKKQQAIQDARQARSLLAQYGQTITTSDLQRTILGINESFAALADTMKDAGYNATGFRNLELARQRAVKEAIEQDRRQQRDLGAEFLNATRTNPLENTLRDIDVQFAHLTETLKDAGYSSAALYKVEQARIRAQREAIEQDRRQQRDLGAQYLSAISKSPLENTLRDIDVQFAHLTETLKDAGYTSDKLANVEKARLRAQDDAIKQAQRQTVEMQKDLESRILGIGSFYDQLIQPLEAVNQNNLLNPAGQIGAARRAFEADLSGAGARDPEAIRRLAGSSQQFQQLVAQNYGTGGVGGQYLREIQSGLDTTISGLKQERQAALADLPQIVQKTTMDIIRENRADIDRVVAELEGLRTDLRTRGVKFA